MIKRSKYAHRIQMIGIHMLMHYAVILQNIYANKIPISSSKKTTANRFEFQHSSKLEKKIEMHSCIILCDYFLHCHFQFLNQIEDN